VALAAFPFNVFITLMMQRNRALYKNKLFYAGFIQFASIIGVIQAGKRFEKIERSCVEKYLSALTIDELKSFDLNKYLAKKNGLPNESNRVSESIYGQQEKFEDF